MLKVGLDQPLPTFVGRREKVKLYNPFLTTLNTFNQYEDDLQEFRLQNQSGSLVQRVSNQIEFQGD